jgi:serine/threonine protein kinase/tetratricopeptide (TPR) repeat protein
MPTQPQNVKDIFLAAVDKTDAGERSAFLDSACAGNPDLRQRIEALLAAHFDASSLLDRPRQDPPPTGDFREGAVLEPTGLPPMRPSLGATIGPYKLLQKLGEGGMGTVWMAEQEEPVKRKVALKVIKPGMDSVQVIARFEQERQALAMMDHPNIAKVLDAGATDGQRPYFVMELVKGIPITKYCDREHLTPKERLQLFIQVCQAVQHAHQKGIIHRDLKPSNVLVGLYDGQPIPKVIDFGVAKAISQKLTERTMFTEVGQVVGTLEYMSPEQAELNNLDIDTRADIYSLGVILYELLTGAPPFSAKQLRGAAFTEMLRLIREVEPPKPSTKLSSSAELANIAANRKLEPKKLTRLVHGDLDWIVMKALEKDRGRRYETANAFAIDIQRHLHDEPVQAGPPGAVYRVRKFVARNKAKVVVTVVVLVSLVGGVTVSTWQAVRATLAEDVAVHERDQAEKARAAEAQQRQKAVEAEAAAKSEAAKAKAVSDFLQEDLLSQTIPELQSRLDRPADPDVKLRTILDRAAEQIGEKFKGQPLVEAEIRKTIGDAYRSTGEYAKARTHLERALELARRELGETHADAMTTAISLAGLFLEDDHNGQAESLMLKVLEAAPKVWGAEAPNTLMAMNNLAMAYKGQRKFAQAEPLLAKVAEVGRRLHGEAHQVTLGAQNNLALVKCELGKGAECEELAQKTLATARQVLGEAHPFTLTAMNNLVNAYQMQGKYVEAEPLLTKLFDLCRKTLGEDHPHTIEVMAAMTELYRVQENYARLEPHLIKMLDLCKRKWGEQHLKTLVTTNELALAYYMQEKFAQAEPLFRKVLEAHTKLLGEDHPETLIVLDSLTATYEKQAKFADAEPFRLRIVEANRRRFGKDSIEVANALASFGRNLIRQGKFPAAELALREALTIGEAKRSGVWAFFDNQSWLGAALAGQKKYAQAEPLLLSGYEGLTLREPLIPKHFKHFVTDALERLVQLYDDWGKKDKAGEWRKKLEAAKAAPKQTPKQ